jgi:lysozyme
VLDVFKDTTDSDTTDSLGTEMDLDVFKGQLREDEGVRTEAYEDTLLNLTVGVGHKVLDSDGLEEGSIINEDTIDRFLDDDASDAISNAMDLVSDWEGLPTNAKYALSNMAFQMGKSGLSKFTETLKLVNAGDYKQAAIEMLDSKWAKQTPKRAKKMSGLMATASR